MTTDEWKRIFASRLRNAIESSGMEKQEIAELANVSPSSISQYLNCSQVPSATAVTSLARVLKVDVEYLVDFEEVIN